jgi:hypothetical protein
VAVVGEILTAICDLVLARAKIDPSHRETKAARFMIPFSSWRLPA